MADGSRDYRDPKLTTRANGRSKKWLWYIVGAVVILLVLAWLSGWSGGAGDGVAVEESVIEENEGTIVVPD